MSINQFSSVTTKAGDEGKTSLANGERRFKSETIFEVLGDLDELSSNLGILKLQFSGLESDEQVPLQIMRIQKTLLSIGGLVASPANTWDDAVLGQLEEGIRLTLSDLEDWEHHFLEGFQFEGFIIPGAALIPAWCDVSRTVCRRTERKLVKHIHESYTEHLRTSLMFLNRLSDYLWVLGRYWVRREGLAEI